MTELSLITTITVVVAVYVWAVVILHLPLIGRDTASRALWAGHFFLACFITLKIWPIHTAVERTLHLPASASVLQHLLLLMAAVAFLVMVDHLTRDPGATISRPRSISWWAAFAAAPIAVLIIASFATSSPVTLPPALDGFSEWYGTSWTAVAQGVPLCCYFVTTQLLGAVFVARNQKHAAAGALRTGMRSNMVGLLTGLGYDFLKLSMFLAWATGNGPGLVAFDRIAETILLAISFIGFGTAQTLVTLAPQLATLRSAGRTAYTLWRLYPLWLTLQAASPRIVLSQNEKVHRYNLAPPSRLSRLLVDRVIEIRDGLLEMRTYAGPDVHRQALSTAQTAGLPEETAQAVAEAVTLEVGRQAKASGGPAHADHTAITGGAALPLDSAWLAHVARTHASNPLITQLAEVILNSGRRPSERA